MRTDEIAIELYKPQPWPSLRDLVAVLFRQWRPMLTVFVLVVVAVLASGLWIPKYEAKMKILVRRHRSDTMVTSSANAPTEFTGDQVSEEDLNSEVELLNSEDLLRRVVTSTGLVTRTSSSSEHSNEVAITTAVRKLSKALEVKPLRKTNVISVNYHDRDPEMAARVLKSLAAAYMEKHLEVNRSSGEVEFFTQQTNQYLQRLNEAQKKLTDFTKSTGVVSADLERDSAIRQANDFEATAREAQTKVLETEQRIAVLKSQMQTMQPRMVTVVHTADNGLLLQQTKSTLLSLELKRTELLTKYEPTYRFVQEVDQQITEAKAAVAAAETHRVSDESSDQDPNYLWVRSELTKAQTDLSGFKERAAQAASNTTKYRETAQRIGQDGVTQQDLQRDAKAQEENYTLYAHKREEARISDALDRRGILNVAVAEAPVVPALPTGSPINIAFVTLLFAGTLGVSAAFAWDFMDPSFRTPQEVTNYLGTPVLAALPKGWE
jgi:uncharacterized protein involved in exopolysaccharide biosynthesis